MQEQRPQQGPIEQAIIPEHNQQYSQADFWESRYSQFVLQNGTEQNTNGDNSLITREWLGNYDAFAHIFRKCVPKTASILILGCGNSLLGEELFDDGYHDVHNIDISESVIALMSKHCGKCAQLKWSSMDCRQLTFADHQFDVVIEKATIEVFFVAERSLWSVSDEAIGNVKRMAHEIARVLKRPAGQFFSISFTAPHFRKHLFERMFVEDRTAADRINIVGVHHLGDHFHYYLYHLSNDPNCTPVSIFSYEPPSCTPVENQNADAEQEQDCDQFLYSISL